MKQTEHILQKSMVTWFRLQYPKFRNNLFAVPNGGQRNVIVASKLKAEGVTAGVSDLIFVYRKEVCFIEVKTPKGRMQDTQLAFEKVVFEAGFPYIVVRTLDEFRDLIDKIMLKF